MDIVEVFDICAIENIHKVVNFCFSTVTILRLFFDISLFCSRVFVYTTKGMRGGGGKTWIYERAEYQIPATNVGKTHSDATPCCSEHTDNERLLTTCLTQCHHHQRPGEITFCSSKIHAPVYGGIHYSLWYNHRKWWLLSYCSRHKR